MSIVQRARIPAALVAGMWTLVIAVALAAVIAAWFAGWRLQSIDSASMSPTVPEGSLAIVIPASGEDAQTGDVIAFRDPVDPHRRLLHRIIGAGTSDTGQRYFQTQGDGNPAPDPLFVPASNVEGQLAWHVPHLGRAAWALRPPLGVVVLAGCPLFLLIASEVLRHLGSRQMVMGGHRDPPPGGQQVLPTWSRGRRRLRLRGAGIEPGEHPPGPPMSR